MVVVLYCVWRFRMKPGEELKDGPPIHGNTRLEIIWTAIPAIILVALCSYAYVDADRHRGGGGQRAQRPRRRRAVHVDLLLQGRRRARTFASPQLYVPARPPGQLHGPVRRRDPRLLGPGLPAEDRRGAGHRHARCASRRRRSASTPSSAPSCAGSATPPCARPPTWSSRRSSTGWLARARRGRRGGPGAGRGGGGAAPDGKTVFTDTGCGALPRARRRRHHRRRRARTSTRCSPTRTRRSSSRASWTRAPRSPQGYSRRDHAAELRADRCNPLSSTRW